MNRQHGMTLVELVIAIVIVGIAAAALYSAMAAITARSADPMLRQQSLMIAEGYLEEILAKPYLAVATPAGCEESERRCFNDLSDYSRLPSLHAPQDIEGTPIASLAAYRVSVSIAEVTLKGVPARQVQVTVRDPRGESLSLSGWRTCYGEVGCP